MAIRKLLLPLTGILSGEAALVTALMVARMWNAHVSVLHVRTDSRDVAPLAGEGLTGTMIQDMMAATDKESAARAHAVRGLFDRIVAASGVALREARCGAGGATASFAAVTGRESDLVAQQARLADLTIVPHPEADQDGSSAEALHAVLFDSGRPLLIASRQAPAGIGRRIAVAWNGTAHAAAAVAAALPWLAQAGAVRLLSSEEYQRPGPGAPELLDYLALHGIAADLATFRPVDRDVGAGLLKAVHDFGADMLCMGAYSHSRLRQFIMGGVTRHALEKADLPVLMNR